MAPGTAISHYRIESRLGGGGMGEVYRAHDTRLSRTVALKLLRPEVAADPDRMRRFEQEARAAAALTHPSVAQVFEIGDHDGARFIAMEYVEGRTLDQVIGGRPMEAARIVDVAAPICEVLAEAHAKGIVHRDIKPGNIMVTERGVPKVLDFGLAKIDRAAGQAAPTLTDPGQVMGTVEYMSPEQALGRDVDARTDIFSFGAVLYEMATGKAAFRGETIARVYDALLNRMPVPVRKINQEAPEALERIIFKALEKDPELRYQTASDLRVDLKRIFHETVILSAAPPAPARRRFGRRGLAAVLALAAVAGAGAWWRWMRLAPRTPGANWRLAPLTSYQGNESHASFSPDGNQVAFTWNGAGEEKWDIYVKVVGEGTPLRLTKDPGNDVSPAWSPDGRHIAFLREGDGGAAVMLVPALGGMERKLGDAWPHRVGVEAPFLAWSPDGKTLAVVDKLAPDDPLGIYLLTIATGERKRLTAPPRDWLGDSCPAFSPDGKTVAFVRTSSVSVQDIYVVPAAGGEPRQITADKRRIFGLAWNSARNRLVFASNRGQNSRLWEVSPSGGQAERLAGIGENAGFLAVSPDGRRLAYTRSTIDTNIWRYTLPRSGGAAEPVRVISSTRHDLAPHLSPDGKRIVFASNRSGTMELWVCDSQGLNVSQLTSFNGPPTGSPRWSPDGRWIAFDSRPEGNPDIYVVAAEGGTPRRMTTHAAEDVAPNWSRDGRWIYFASKRSGDYQVWKAPAEGGDAVQVTRQGGFFAAESADRRYLYYAKALNGPGLWRMSLAGGAEEPVLESLRAGYSYYWELGDQGVYYLERRDQADGRTFHLCFFDLASRKEHLVRDLDKRPFNAGLSFAPDGKSFLYAQVDSSDTDLMLVDDFHLR